MACYERAPHLIHTRTIASAFTIASATEPALAPRTRSVPPIVQVQMRVWCECGCGCGKEELRDELSDKKEQESKSEKPGEKQTADSRQGKIGREGAGRAG